MTDKLPDEIEIPDSIEPIVMWKTLVVSPAGHLYSPSRGMPWLPKQRAEATCSKQWDYGWEPVRGEVTIPENIDEQGMTFYATSSGQVPVYYTHPQTPPMPQVQLPNGLRWSWEPQPHQIVGDGCHCGIYAVDNAEACLSYGGGSKRVICKISMWGRVVKGTSGARAQYAYPQSIEFASNLTNDELIKLAERYGMTLPESIPDTSAITNPTTTTNALWITLNAPTSTFTWQPINPTPDSDDEDEDNDFLKEIITISAYGIAFFLLVTIMLIGPTAVIRLCAAFAVLAAAVAIASWSSKKNA